MRTLSILQVGDIHYPNALASSSRIDWKDSGFPKRLGEAITPHPLQDSLRAAAKQRVDALFVCGDITDKGDLLGYQTGVAHLINVFGLKDTTAWSADQIHCVPGNHDLDRRAYKPTSSDLFDKFKPLKETWDRNDLSILTTQSVRRTVIKSSACEAHLLSLNSCIGCGEIRFVPKDIQKSLTGLLKKYLGKDPKRLFELLGQQLDTPAFVEEHLVTLSEALDDLPRKSVAFVLAHHNVLPQATPRIEIYTEVINGGLLRSRLTKNTVPVIYCHGHIHEDPIEVIRIPDGASFISISAPLLERGFNVIEIEFSRNGYPLGCHVKAFRRNLTGSLAVDGSRSARIPLSNGKWYRQIGHEDLATILLQIPAEPAYFGDVLQSVRQTREIRAAALADIMKEAEWLGFIQIENREREFEFWQIEKVIP